jgi:hypothetical protein
MLGTEALSRVITTRASPAVSDKAAHESAAFSLPETSAPRPGFSFHKWATASATAPAASPRWPQSVAHRQLVESTKFTWRSLAINVQFPDMGRGM